MIILLVLILLVSLFNTYLLLKKSNTKFKKILSKKGVKILKYPVKDEQWVESILKN